MTTVDVRRYRSMYDVPITPVKPSQSKGEAGGGGMAPKRSTTSRAASKVELNRTQKGKGKKRTVSKYEDDDDYDVDDDDDDSDESMYSDETDDDDDEDYTDTECDDDDDNYDEDYDDDDDDSGVDDHEANTALRGKSLSADVSKSRKSKKTVTSATTPTLAIKPCGLQQHDVARVLSKYMQLSKEL